MTEAAVPIQQSRVSGRTKASTPPIKQSTQTGEQSMIRRPETWLVGRPKARSDYLRTEHDNLVPENDNLNGQLFAVVATDYHQLEDSDESKVEGHTPVP